MRSARSGGPLGRHRVRRARVSAIGRAVADAATALGGLDVLVYAAAGGFRAARPEDVDAGALRRGRRHDPARRVLRGAGGARGDGGRGGVIIFITDVAAMQAWPSFAPHSVAKAGLVHLTEVLAKAWAPRCASAASRRAPSCPRPAAMSASLRASGERRCARAHRSPGRHRRGGALPRRGRLRHRHPARRRRWTAAVCGSADSRRARTLIEPCNSDTLHDRGGTTPAARYVENATARRTSSTAPQRCSRCAGSTRRRCVRSEITSASARARRTTTRRTRARSSSTSTMSSWISLGAAADEVAVGPGSALDKLDLVVPRAAAGDRRAQDVVTVVLHERRSLPEPATVAHPGEA